MNRSSLFIPPRLLLCSSLILYNSICSGCHHVRDILQVFVRQVNSSHVILTATGYIKTKLFIFLSRLYFEGSIILQSKVLPSVAPV